MTTPLTCWVISDGRRGIENQALGLAEGLGRLRPISLETKVLSTDDALKPAPSILQLAFKSKPEDYGFGAPFPQLVIGCGRQAIAPLRALKKSLGSEIFTIYVQDPRISSKHFDLVIAPEHDQLSGKNVIPMIGSPNRVTNNIIIGETLKFSHALGTVPAPRIAMLIGGSSKTHELDETIHAAHMQAAHTILAQKLSLLITTSRRTPDFAIKDYTKLEKERENIWLYKGNEDNPYFAFVGSADAILVTEDSTNMLTEACATGKPVFTLPMTGAPGKFQILYDRLKTRCNVEAFSGVFDAPDYPALLETDRVAKLVHQQLTIAGI